MKIIGRPINEVISTTSMLDVLKKRYAETAIMSMCILINRGNKG